MWGGGGMDGGGGKGGGEVRGDAGVAVGDDVWVWGGLHC